MRRVVPAFVSVLGAGVLLAGMSGARAAECRQEISSAQTKLTTVSEPAKRHEIDLLLKKAQSDGSAGRVNLCTDAVRHANLLLK